MSPSPLDWLPEGRALIGVVHLAPLPGSPEFEGSLDAVLRRAGEDGSAWKEGGADAVIVENFGDSPFFAGAVPPETVASMTAAARIVAESSDLPIGINVLRNDAGAALAVAVAAGARFIRVNVLAHAYLTDQGVVEGRAASLLRKRKILGAPVDILADVLVKHAVPLAPIAAPDAARDLASRAGADALVVTGDATGDAPTTEAVKEVAAAGTGAPVFVGSGITPDNAEALLGSARGAIVGTWCKSDGRVDPARIRILARTLRGMGP